MGRPRKSSDRRSETAKTIGGDRISLATDVGIAPIGRIVGTDRIVPTDPIDPIVPTGPIV